MVLDGEEVESWGVGVRMKLLDKYRLVWWRDGKPEAHQQNYCGLYGLSVLLESVLLSADVDDYLIKIDNDSPHWHGKKTYGYFYWNNRRDEYLRREREQR